MNLTRYFPYATDINLRNFLINLKLDYCLLNHNLARNPLTHLYIYTALSSLLTLIYSFSLAFYFSISISLFFLFSWSFSLWIKSYLLIGKSNLGDLDYYSWVSIIVFLVISFYGVVSF